MRGFSFESFVLSDANREAYEAARQVADIAWEGPRPIVFWGATGAGKSHLLWSIVKAVRAGSVRAGLALVLAREFPQKVRDLANNPAPIQRGSPAILLVDELEDFEDGIEDLERVARTFLAEGHQVVFASHIHPDHLTRLSSPFRALLAEGTLIEVGLVAGTGDGPGQRLAQAERALQELQAERDQLELRLAEKAALAAEATLLRTTLGNVESELSALRASHEALIQEQPSSPEYAQELGRLQDTVTRLQAEQAAIEQERDALEQKLAERAGVQQELESVRLDLIAARRDGEMALAEKDGLAEALGTMERERDEARNALAQTQEQIEALATMEQERDEARSELAETHERLEALVGDWEAREVAWTDQLNEVLARSLAITEKAVAQAGQSGSAQSLQAAEEALAEAQESIVALEQRLDEEQIRYLETEKIWQRDMADMDQRVASLSTALEEERSQRRAAAEAHDADTRERDKARRQLALMAAEMEALRHEAAGQVARANMQAGELEGRIADLASILGWRQEEARNQGGKVAAIVSGITRSLEPLYELARDLENSAAPLPERNDTGEAESKAHDAEAAWLEQQAFFFPADDEIHRRNEESPTGGASDADTDHQDPDEEIV